MPNLMYKGVSKVEFDEFVSNYPRSLEKHVTRICEPPLLTYNDFTKGNWPDSVVARVVLAEDYPPELWEPNSYSIRQDEDA